MPAKRLTEESVLRLPYQSKPYQVQDFGTDAVRGLSVLVSPSGNRTYRILYRLGSSGQRLAMQLGAVGEMTLGEAREQARDVRKRAANGENPKQGAARFSDKFKQSVERGVEEKHEGEGCVSA
jgi:hypothetical protein